MMCLVCVHPPRTQVFIGSERYDLVARVHVVCYPLTCWHQFNTEREQPILYSVLFCYENTRRIDGLSIYELLYLFPYLPFCLRYEFLA